MPSPRRAAACKRPSGSPAKRRAALAAATALLALASLARGSALAQARGANDPYRYDLRIGLAPVAFQGGISQSHFGSAARVEIDLARHVGVELAGQLPWANVAGESGPQAWAGRASVLLHVIDREESTPLSGTVYPQDTPAVGGRGPGTDTDLDVPVHSKLGGPPLLPPDRERGAEAPLRKLHTIRVGYDFERAVERGRPDAYDGSTRRVLNTLHVLHLGYGWSALWNLSPALAGGKREVGWRTFYADALLTLPALAHGEALGASAGDPVKLFPLGLRIGMQGAIDALLHAAPGLGFAYSLELGALPGRSGVEGYVFVGLGLALDLPLRGRSLRRR